MADVKMLSANNVDYSIKDEVARTALANLGGKVLNHYSAREPVNIETALAAKSEAEFYEYRFMANGNTGELVSLAHSELFKILNIPSENGGTGGVLQIAFGIDNTCVWYRRYTWWTTSWSQWRPLSYGKYNTGETITGEYWTDGKPIYRRVYKGPVSSSGQILISSTNVDSLVKYDSWYRVNTTYFKCWYDKQAGAVWCVATINSNTLNVRFDCSGTTITEVNEVCCIVEYTKTTD